MNESNAIEVEHLEKGYKEVPVLDDVSFTVRRGTVFALLGANGSGKTTTINILTTLIKADGGTADCRRVRRCDPTGEGPGADQCHRPVRSRRLHPYRPGEPGADGRLASRR